jgi:hypothetical protein
MGTVLIPNASASQKTTFAAETHLIEGKFLREEQTLDTERKSLIYREGTRKPKVSKQKDRI